MWLRTMALSMPLLLCWIPAKLIFNKVSSSSKILELPNDSLKIMEEINILCLSLYLEEASPYRTEIILQTWDIYYHHMNISMLEIGGGNWGKGRMCVVDLNILLVNLMLIHFLITKHILAFSEIINVDLTEF